MKRIYIVVSLCVLLLSGGCAPLAGSRPLIGATADVAVAEAALTFRARVDSGAHTCSVHAEDIRVENGAPDPAGNVGKPVAFTLVSPDGRRIPMTLPVAGVSTVRTSEGSERRYQVELTLETGGVSKRVRVNLNDRARMTYKMLLGRNFLSGWLIDVDR